MILINLNFSHPQSLKEINTKKTRFQKLIKKVEFYNFMKV